MKRPNLNRQGSNANKNPNFAEKQTSNTNSNSKYFSTDKGIGKTSGNRKNSNHEDNEPKENTTKLSSRFKFLRSKINPTKELENKDYIGKTHSDTVKNTSHEAKIKAPKIEKETFIRSIRKINKTQKNEAESENLNQRILREKRERKRKIQNNSSSPHDLKSTRRFNNLRDTSFKITQKGSSNIMLTVVAVFLVVGACLVFMAPTIKAWIVQSQDYNRVENQIEQTRKHNQELKNKLQKLNESSYVADQARQRLGYVRKGETTYVVVDPQTITKQKQDDSVAQKAPRKPWFSLIKDSVKAIEESKTSDKKKAVKKQNEGKENTDKNQKQGNNGKEDKKKSP